MAKHTYNYKILLSNFIALPLLFIVLVILLQFVNTDGFESFGYIFIFFIIYVIYFFASIALFFINRNDVSIVTLGIILKEGKIILCEMKKGIEQGYLSGIGGKINDEKEYEKSLIIDAKEEVGIDIISENIYKKGIFNIYFKNNPELNQELHLYLITDYTGNFIETGIMKPISFDINNIPYEKMWESYKIWLPRILNGGSDIEYNFYYDRNDGKLIDYILIS